MGREQQDQKQRTIFLPNEIWTEIVSYLDDLSIILTSLTCRQLRTILPRHLKDIPFQYAATALPIDTGLTLIRRHTRGLCDVEYPRHADYTKHLSLLLHNYRQKEYLYRNITCSYIHFFISPYYTIGFDDMSRAIRLRRWDIFADYWGIQYAPMPPHWKRSNLDKKYTLNWMNLARFAPMDLLVHFYANVTLRVPGVPEFLLQLVLNRRTDVLDAIQMTTLRDHVHLMTDVLKKLTTYSRPYPTKVAKSKINTMLSIDERRDWRVVADFLHTTKSIQYFTDSVLVANVTDILFLDWYFFAYPERETLVGSAVAMRYFIFVIRDMAASGVYRKLIPLIQWLRERFNFDDVPCMLSIYFKYFFNTVVDNDNLNNSVFGDIIHFATGADVIEDALCRVLASGEPNLYKQFWRNDPNFVIHPSLLQRILSYYNGCCRKYLSRNLEPRLLDIEWDRLFIKTYQYYLKLSKIDIAQHTIQPDLLQAAMTANCSEFATYLLCIIRSAPNLPLSRYSACYATALKHHNLRLAEIMRSMRIPLDRTLYGTIENYRGDLMKQYSQTRVKYFYEMLLSLADEYEKNKMMKKKTSRATTIKNGGIKRTLEKEEEEEAEETLDLQTARTRKRLRVE